MYDLFSLGSSLLDWLLKMLCSLVGAVLGGLAGWKLGGYLFG